MGVLLSFSDRKSPGGKSAKTSAGAGRKQGTVIAHPSAGMRDIENLMRYIAHRDAKGAPRR